MDKGGACQGNPEEQLSRFPTELLDCTCAEAHLAKLVHMIDTKSVVLLATDLELLAADRIDGIQNTWSKMSAAQRLEIFKTWQQDKKSQATYRYDMMFEVNGIVWAFLLITS